MVAVIKSKKKGQLSSEKEKHKPVSVEIRAQGVFT